MVSKGFLGALGPAVLVPTTSVTAVVVAVVLVTPISIPVALLERRLLFCIILSKAILWPRILSSFGGFHPGPSSQYQNSDPVRFTGSHGHLLVCPFTPPSQGTELHVLHP